MYLHLKFMQIPSWDLVAIFLKIRIQNVFNSQTPAMKPHFPFPLANIHQRTCQGVEALAALS